MKSTINKRLKLRRDFLILPLIVLITLNSVFPYAVFSQEKAQQKMLDGIHLFWNAKFDEAIEVLQEAININTLSKNELFSAYLYMGFSLLRKDSQLELVEQIFRQAVKVNPRLRLDSLKIPPDLLNSFEQVRKGMIGSFYITSNPSRAKVIGFSPETKIEFKGWTPYLFDNLLVGTYDILISKKDYQEEIGRFNLSPTAVDTLKIVLKLKEKPFYKKWWTWTAGGGVALATIAAIILAKEPSKTQPEHSDLPIPPDRPL